MLVEPEDGHVFGHAQAEFVERADGSHRADVIECKQRRECFACSQEFLRRLVAQVGRGRVVLNLRDQFLAEGQAHGLRNLHDGIPAHFGVGNESLAAKVRELHKKSVDEDLARKMSNAPPSFDPTQKEPSH